MINHINPKLESFIVPISELSTDPENARKHSERNIKSIMESLLKYGQQIPLVAYNKVIKAGSGRLEAARRLNWDRIAVIDFHLAESLAGSFALADNRTAELAEWNFETLSHQLELFGANGNLEHLWTDEERNNLIQADWVTPPPSNDSVIPNEEQEEETEKIVLTPTQYKTIKKAIDKVRTLSGHFEWKEGLCLALIAERSL